MALGKAALKTSLKSALQAYNTSAKAHVAGRIYGVLLDLAMRVPAGMVAPALTTQQTTSMHFLADGIAAAVTDGENNEVELDTLAVAFSNAIDVYVKSGTVNITTPLGLTTTTGGPVTGTAPSAGNIV